MTRWLPLVLLACAPPPDTDTVDAPDTDTDVAPAVLPIVPQIADAPDLDDDPDVLRVSLVAAPHSFEIGGETVDGYAYNGQVPGPTLRAKVGDTIIVDIRNDLDVPTTVHWHGLHVPYAMDGVTWSQAPINPGETFTATFLADHAGTAWYHPHFDTARQVDLGLYGVVVVTDPAEPQPDHDVVIVADSWGEHGARMPDGGDNHHGVDGADIAWSLNGVLAPARLPMPSGETARVRVLNASNAGYLDLHPGDAQAIAGDQGLWAAPGGPRHILAPGDRVDLSLALGAADVPVQNADYSLYGGSVDEGLAAPWLVVEPEGTSDAPTPLSWPHSGEPPLEDPGWTDLRFVLQGDAGTNSWTINGERFPDVTVSALELGQDTVIEVRNVSPTHHPFHMHGHALEILSIDGVPPATRTVEDTFDVGIRQTVRIRLIADNPGSWMTHCHILPHASGGMMTVVDVLTR